MQSIPIHIHFVGIAGIGVSALAQVAQARGIRVSGSDPHADPQTNPAIDRLQAGGATLYTKHEAANLAEDVDLVVASAAIAAANPEVREAQRRGLRIVSRAEFLGELMAAHKGPTVAIAGTHGKTTTTAMIGLIFQHAGLDPTVFVGGEVPQLGGNVRIGSETGPFVAEACEAYDSFLHLKPDYAVITNIEADHLDHYGTFERMLDGFRAFVRNVKTDIVANADDPGVDRISDDIADHMPYRAFSLRGKVGGLWAENIKAGRVTTFDLITGTPDGPVQMSLRVPGMHNVANAVAAATAVYAMSYYGEPGVPNYDRTVSEALALFRGVGRRQEILGEIVIRGSESNPPADASLGPQASGLIPQASVLVMDDYAHHPTEIGATIEALRAAYPDRRLIAVFQPHLYSRTRDFLDRFAEALSGADVLIVTGIYAAREAPMPGVTAEDIVRKALEIAPDLSARYVPEKSDIPATLREIVRPNDLVLVLGAGDIREQGETFVRLMQQQEQSGE